MLNWHTFSYWWDLETSYDCVMMSIFKVILEMFHNSCRHGKVTCGIPETSAKSRQGSVKRKMNILFSYTAGLPLSSAFIKWTLSLSLQNLGTSQRGWWMHRKPGRACHELPGARHLTLQPFQGGPESFTPDSKQGKHLRGGPWPGKLWTQAWENS